MSSLPTSNPASDAIPKWQIALAVGVPLGIAAAGLGWYYYSSKPSAPPEDKAKSKKKEDKKEEKVEPAIPKTPHAQAIEAKERGNRFFKERKFLEAIEAYDLGIKLCPTTDKEKTDLSHMYQNRAACHEALKNPEEVEKDCTMSLSLNPRYVKALVRRAKARQGRGALREALEDVTAACILEGFSNNTSMGMADSLLKELGAKSAREAMMDRTPTMPSNVFIRHYFTSFTRDPLQLNVPQATANGSDAPSSVSNGVHEAGAEGSGDDPAALSPFQRACQAHARERYSLIVPLCSEEIELEGSQFRNEALVSRGTFNFLMGNVKEALEDLNAVIDNKMAAPRLKSNALMKRGTINVHCEEREKALDDLNTGIDIDPLNPDLYHQKAQICLLLDRLQEALESFEKAISLDADFKVSHIQKNYVLFRKASKDNDRHLLEEALSNFKRNINRYPDEGEAYSVFAQALTEQGQFKQAEELFQKALQKDPENAILYVHLGMLTFQSSGDTVKAIESMEKAIQVDPKCAFALEALGTVLVQKGELSKAISLFDRAIKMAKAEAELTHLFSLKIAAEVQIQMGETLGISLPTL